MRRLVVSSLVPLAERTLLVRVDEPRRAVARPAGLNRKIGGKGGLAAATLLRSDDDCFQ
jgi:hypothetical protein